MERSGTPEAALHRGDWNVTVKECPDMYARIARPPFGDWNITMKQGPDAPAEGLPKRPPGAEADVLRRSRLVRPRARKHQKPEDGRRGWLTGNHPPTRQEAEAATQRRSRLRLSGRGCG